MPIGFGPFAFDRQSRLLWRDGTEVALPPRVLGVLEVLIDRPGEVVARQDLLDGVWKDAFVTDTSLAEAVSYLRQALGDDPQAPRYIQTVHRRGYRFLPPLSDVPARGQTPAVAASGVRPRSLDYPPEPSMAYELVPWIAALVCAALAVGALTRIASTPAPETALVARFDVQAAPGTAFDQQGPSLAVSADGRVLAWSACEKGTGTCGLYVRPVDRLEPTRLAGTEGGTAPFFSPDGRWIGFFGEGKLKKISAAGGSPSILADAPAPGGAAWGPNGRIVFAGAPAGGLSLVSDQGGAVTALTTPLAERGELRHVSPSWLPNGAAILFTSTTSPAADAPGSAAVFAIGSSAHRMLRGGVTLAIPAGPGYVLLANGHDLQVATFDDRTLTLTGGADSVLASVLGGDAGVAQVAVSPAGTLAAYRTPAPGTFTWSDHADAHPGSVARLTSIAVSPDSRRAAGVIADGNSSDVWIADLQSGALTRVTYGGTNVAPAWSADGTRVYFASRTSGPFAIASRAVAGRDTATIARADHAHLFPSSVAPDGRLAATITLPGGRTGVALVAAGGGAPQLLNDGPFDQAAAAFSPDGQWLALESSESGRTEIVLRGSTDGRRAAISADGGTHPRWSADGRAVYFDAGRRLMRASFDPARGLQGIGRPVAIVDRDGGRVLAVTPSGRMLIHDRAPGSDAVLVILQWLRELRERIPQPTAVPR
jgi:serine/threonine-protein kinase